MLQVDYKNISQIFKLNLKKPSLNLNSLNFGDQINFPIFVTNFMGVEQELSRSTTELDNQYYLVDAVQIDMPEPSKVGDLQIDLNANGFMFNK